MEITRTNLPAKTIRIEKTVYKKQMRYLLRFSYDPGLIDLVRKLPGRCWSSALGCWHIPFDRNLVIDLIKMAPEKVRIESEQDTNDVKHPVPKVKKEDLITPKPKETDKIDITFVMKDFDMYLKSRRYSNNTVRTYTDALAVFLKFFRKKPINEITNEDVVLFNNVYILKNKYSSSYQNQVINAIKLYFRKLQNIKIDIEELHRPKRGHLLPMY